MPLVPVTVKVVTDDVTPAPIDGVVIRAYTNPGNVFVTEGTTGNPTPGSGEVDLALDSGASYYFRASQVGTSFPGAPFSLAVVVPPPLNTLLISAHVGETAQVVTFELQDDLALPLEGVIARVYDENDIYITDLITDANGITDISLEGAPDPGKQYIIRWRPPAGYTIQGGNTQIIAVLDPLVSPDTNEFEFVAETQELPESDDSAMCLISGYLADISRGPIRDGTIVFLPRLFEPEAKVSGFPFPTEPTVLGRHTLITEVRARSNSDGYVEIKLPRTSIFDAHLYGLETPGAQIFAQVYVPDRAGAKLEDILFPYTASVDTEVGSIALAVDEKVELSITAVGSNGQPGLENCPGLFEFESSDEAIVGYEFENGVLIIAGVSVGSATVTVSRIDGTSAVRVPSIPDLIITPAIEITVTVS